MYILSENRNSPQQRPWKWSRSQEMLHRKLRRGDTKGNMELLAQNRPIKSCRHKWKMKMERRIDWRGKRRNELLLSCLRCVEFKDKFTIL